MLGAYIVKALLPLARALTLFLNIFFEHFYALLLGLFWKTNKRRTDKLSTGCFSICLETKIEIWKYCKQDTFYVSLEPFYLLFSIKLNWSLGPNKNAVLSLLIFLSIGFDVKGLIKRFMRYYFQSKLTPKNPLIQATLSNNSKVEKITKNAFWKKQDWSTRHDLDSLKHHQSGVMQ